MSQHTTTQTHAQAPEPTLTDLVDHLTRFEGPPDQFLLHLLAVQCHVGGAEGGAIVRTRTQQPEVLAVYPPPPQQDQTAPVWLAQAVESALRVAKGGETVIFPFRSSDDFYEQAPNQSLMLIPLRAAEGVRGVTAFVIPSALPNILRESRMRLELTTSLLSLYEMRLTVQRRQADLQRLRQGMEVLSSINENERFKAAAMAFCNEIASAWNTDRVSLGFLKGRYVKAVAMSHTEKFTRKMKLVLDIESAMEECLDQDVEVIHPAVTEATYVSRAAAELAGRHGPNAVLSLPLRQGAKTVGVLTLERAVDNPFQLDEIESLRLVCDLCTARLGDLHEHDKWLGAKVAGGMRKGLAMLVGAEHTWVKVAAIAVFLAIVFFTFAKGTDWAEGSFVVETMQLQVVPAPFPGYIDTVHVQEGDAVSQGQLLGSLKTEELELRLHNLEAERLRAETDRDTALRDADRDLSKLADRREAEARVVGVQADINLARYQLQLAELTAPMAGVVVRDNELNKKLGAPVEQGQVLFEIAPIEALRAEVQVPESRIADVKVGSSGELAPVSSPGLYVPFVVERITPMAEMVNQRNVYRVRVRFDLSPDEITALSGESLRPGSAGVARIETGRARFAWLWTRDMINWVRMKLWW